MITLMTFLEIGFIIRIFLLDKLIRIELQIYIESIEMVTVCWYGFELLSLNTIYNFVKINKKQIIINEYNKAKYYNFVQ